MDEGVPTRPAGFWIRTVALALDLIVYFLVDISLSRLARVLWGPGLDGDSTAEGAVLLFTVLFAIVYTTTLHAMSGQTLGKAVVGIRVVAAADGALLTVGPALLRHLASFLSSFPVGFGYIMAGLRRDKRALHDLIAGSRVEWVPRRRVSRRLAPRSPGPGLQDAAVAPAPPEPTPASAPEPRA
jgi:uncharacterized RDD family membrane protein YckC